MGSTLGINRYSPLRYPGGKGKLSNYIKVILKENNLIGGHYFEPYAGGASVALTLLFDEYVDCISINDKDYTVYCFWKSILNKSDQFCNLVMKTPVTLKEWSKQKEIQRQPRSFSQLEVGFSTFFLNRTNRSGILKGGVIGGKHQEGNWKIDARFNKENLIERLQLINLYSERIDVTNNDALQFLQESFRNVLSKSFYYLDPPYYKRGKDLYLNFYNHNDHLSIAKCLKKFTSKKWIVSYDNDENIRQMYSNFRSYKYHLNYHASNPSVGSELIVFSDKLEVPDINDPMDNRMIRKMYPTL